jgi:UDP-3-O-[3-hydroxymyristoyl] glucosamine N-acyltransferase
VQATLKSLADLVGGEVLGDPSVLVSGVGGIREALPGQITFLAHRRFERMLATTRASAVVVGPDTDPGPLPAVRVADPDYAFGVIAERFLGAAPRPAPGVRPGAHVADSARLGAGVAVLPGAVVEDGASIGDRTILHPGAYVGPGARVGADCVLHPHVVVRERVVLGDRVIVHAGAVIGADGFGYAGTGRARRKIPQGGIVVVEDDVEIGANTTIDRARFDRTRVGRGTKIDNLVQIGHNVHLGEDCVVVAQAGIAGSARLGDRVTLAAQSGVAGHVEIGEDAVIAARGGVTKSLPGRAAYSGFPARPHSRARRETVLAARLPELRAALRSLRARVRALESRIQALERPPKNH